MPATFVEKIFNAPQGAIVFKRPDLVLTHDNSASIRKTFELMGGAELHDPEQLVIVLDHNAPPTNAALANTYQAIRDFAIEQGIRKFHDAGSGICHQIMAEYARLLPSNMRTALSGDT
jgi:3-isopropylmalate/(R)-2-methylmalate dehydratase large subunit